MKERFEKIVGNVLTAFESKDFAAMPLSELQNAVHVLVEARALIDKSYSEMLLETMMHTHCTTAVPTINSNVKEENA